MKKRDTTKLADYISVVCPPSSICSSCSKWSDKTGCPEGDNATGIAVFGVCDKKEPKNTI